MLKWSIFIFSNNGISLDNIDLIIERENGRIFRKPKRVLLENEYENEGIALIKVRHFNVKIK